MIKIIILFIVLFFKFNFVNSAPDINAKTAILVDYNSDKILFGEQRCSITELKITKSKVLSLKFN